MGITITRTVSGGYYDYNNMTVRGNVLYTLKDAATNEVIYEGTNSVSGYARGDSLNKVAPVYKDGYFYIESVPLYANDQRSFKLELDFKPGNSYETEQIYPPEQARQTVITGGVSVKNVVLGQTSGSAGNYPASHAPKILEARPDDLGGFTCAWSVDTYPTSYVVAAVTERDMRVIESTALYKTNNELNRSYIEGYRPPDGFDKFAFGIVALKAGVGHVTAMSDYFTVTPPVPFVFYDDTGTKRAVKAAYYYDEAGRQRKINIKAF